MLLPPVAMLAQVLVTVRVRNVSGSNNSIPTGGAGWGPDPRHQCPPPSLAQSNHGIGIADNVTAFLWFVSMFIVSMILV